MHISPVTRLHPVESDQPSDLDIAFHRILNDARQNANPYLEDCLVPGGGE